MEDFRLIVDEGSHVDGGQAVGDFVATAKNLRKLQLENCNIGDDGDLLAQICHGLQAETCVLKELCLGSNVIDNSGAALLSTALLQNDSVEKVVLCHNRIGDNGAVSVAEAVEQNNSVVHLNFCGNKIGSIGAGAFAGALRVNSSLKHLNLNLNKIDDGIVEDDDDGGHGFIQLADSLTSNATLEGLYTSWNDSKGLNCLIRNLPQMSLKELQFDIDGTTIMPEQTVSFLTAARQNTSIEKYDIKVENNIRFLESLPELKDIAKRNKINNAISLVPLMLTIPGSLWPRVLSNTSNDADILFLFLRENPSLMKRSLLGKRKRSTFIS